MKQFTANSNYNVTIYAKDRLSAQKMYNNAVINSLFITGETLTPTELKEIDINKDLSFENVLENEAIFFIINEKRMYLNGKIIKIDFTYNYTIRLLKTKIQTNDPKMLFETLSNPFWYCYINKFTELYK